jgi:TRAP transporter TAXI family solute receptor
MKNDITKIFKFIFCFYIIFASNAWCEEATKQNESYKSVIFISSGSSSGIYYSLASSICMIFNSQTKTDKVCKVISSMGSDENIQNLADNKTSLAIIQPLSLMLAQMKKPEILSKLNIITSLHKEDYLLFTRVENLSIRNVSNLRSRNINAGPDDSNSRLAMALVLKAGGLDFDDVHPLYKTTQPMQGDLLCNGKIDAALYVVGSPSSVVNQATSNCELSLVPIKGAIAERTINDPNLFFEKSIIGADNYPGIIQDVETLAERALLVANENFDNDSIEELMNILKTNVDKLKNMHPAFSSIDFETILPRELYGVHSYKSIKQ